MELVKNYRHDAALRRSFNALAEEAFGIDFETWYRLGYWREDYIPYSVVDGGSVVANVSVNRTDFSCAGETVRLIQLGTVMTHPDYRGRGLIRMLMAEIEKDWAGEVEGMYLFANDGVLDFYPRFGFRPGRETAYEKAVGEGGVCLAVRRSMAEEENRAVFEHALADGMSGAFPMVGNAGLVFFYASSFMSENVWYVPGLDAWAVAETEGEELLLHAVCGASTGEMIAAFGGAFRRVKLGYVPEEEGFAAADHHEEDCTFFVKGAFFDAFEEKKLRIPTLSHA